MSIRIISFLGLGSPQTPHYTPCRYELDGSTSVETPLKDVALVHAGRAAGDEVELIVVGTAQVRERWFGENKLFESYLEKADATPNTLRFTELPSGATNQERWTIFYTLRDLFQPPTPQASPPLQVWVDITHGFRSQPFFAAAVLSYVQSECRRTKQPLMTRILYGAFEARDLNTNIAPVWDLSQFLNVTAWDASVDALMRFGRADDLKSLLKQQQSELMRRRDRSKREPTPILGKLGDALQQFADDLVTARIHNLITRSSRYLAETLEAAREDVLTYAPPLQDSLTRLQTWVQQMSAENTISEEGIQAAIHIASAYTREFERYAEAAVLMRESLISAWTVTRRPTSTILQPGQNDNAFKEQRAEDEKSLSDLVIKKDNRPIPLLAGRLHDLRNDIQHGGIRPDPRPATGILKDLKNILDEWQKTRTPQQFVNCSNHPSVGWTASQRAAAEAFGAATPCGSPNIVDVPFPQVDPSLDKVAIESLAKTTCKEILNHNPHTVHVMGEMTLTLAIVSYLQKLNIPCVASTSERIVEETRHTNGAVTHNHIFNFVAFRAYLSPYKQDNENR